MKYIFLVNSGSKEVNDDFVKKLEKLLSKKKNTELVVLIKGQELESTLSKLPINTSTVLVACGGDGTLKTVAEKSIEKNCYLGVIPAGTYNHFAKTMGISLSLNKAIKNLYDTPRLRYIDVGKVNNNIFLNNSSVGLYSRLVKKREYWESKNVPKIIAMILAGFWLMFHMHRLHYKIKINNNLIDSKFSLIFIGNGLYQYANGSFSRTKTTNNKLMLYLFGGTNIFDLIKSVHFLVTGRGNKLKIIKEIECDSFTLYSSKQELSVALDGEVIKAKTPLKYNFEPKVLKLFS